MEKIKLWRRLALGLAGLNCLFVAWFVLTQPIFLERPSCTHPSGDTVWIYGRYDARYIHELSGLYNGPRIVGRTAEARSVFRDWLDLFWPTTDFVDEPGADLYVTLFDWLRGDWNLNASHGVLRQRMKQELGDEVYRRIEFAHDSERLHYPDYENSFSTCQAIANIARLGGAWTKELPRPVLE